MCIRIHNHMRKMPLCRSYFSMLAVIDFFSSYFSTLKAHRKTPVLPPMPVDPTLRCPPLFPHLPVRKLFPINQTVNLSQVGDLLLKEPSQRELERRASWLFHPLSLFGYP